MKISTRNLIFRWAYLFTRQSRRDYMKHTTLCDLFWRAILLTPLQVITLSLPVVFVSLLIAVFGWIPFAQAVGMTALALLGILVFVAFLVWLENAPTSKPMIWASEVYRGYKDRYCPLVRVEQDRE